MSLIPLGNAMLQDASEASAPWPINEFSTIVANGPVGLLIMLAALLLAKVIVTFARVALTADLRRRVWRAWSLRLVGCFVDMPYPRWLEQDSGELINLVGNELNRGTGLITFVISFAVQFFSFVVLLLALLFNDWRLVVAALVVGIFLYLLAIRHLNATAAEYGTASVVFARNTAGLLAETMQGIRDIRLLGAEKKRLKDVDEVVRRMSDNYFWLTIFQAIPANAIELILAFLVICAAISLSIQHATASYENLPTIIFFIVGLFRLAAYVASLSTLYVKLVSRWPSMVAVLNALDSGNGSLEVAGLGYTDYRDEAKMAYAERPKIGFTLRGLSFQHGNRHVLADVNLDLPIGSVTYLLGPSGSGKSTIADLLARLQEPTRGSILMDMADASLVPLARWRDIVGYVSQEPVLFSGTLFDNIVIGRPFATQDEVEDALSIAGANDLIKVVAGGLMGQLAERGRNLSGGQRCRIAIARCLLRKPALLILDESTGGLEGEIEADIIERIRALPGIAVLVISHRLENAHRADQIVFLDAGRLKVDRPILA